MNCVGTVTKVEAPVRHHLEDRRVGIPEKYINDNGSLSMEDNKRMILFYKGWNGRKTFLHMDSTCNVTGFFWKRRSRARRYAR
jgi:hypothetical protein